MSGRRPRDKGSRGELEVVAILRGAGFDARRTPNSGGLSWRGDVVGMPGYVLEVKRQERLDIPGWLRQAYAASSVGDVPVVAFRRSARQGAVQRDPDTLWHVVLPLDEFVRLISTTKPAEAGSEAS